MVNFSQLSDIEQNIKPSLKTNLPAEVTYNPGDGSLDQRFATPREPLPFQNWNEVYESVNNGESSITVVPSFAYEIFNSIGSTLTKLYASILMLCSIASVLAPVVVAILFKDWRIALGVLGGLGLLRTTPSKHSLIIRLIPGIGLIVVGLLFFDNPWRSIMLMFPLSGMFSLIAKYTMVHAAKSVAIQSHILLQSLIEDGGVFLKLPGSTSYVLPGILGKTKKTPGKRTDEKILPEEFSSINQELANVQAKIAKLETKKEVATVEEIEAEIKRLEQEHERLKQGVLDTIKSMGRPTEKPSGKE